MRLNYAFDTCKDNLLGRADTISEEEAQKTNKFWISFNNTQFERCDRYLGAIFRATKKLANTRTGKNLKTKMDAVKNMPEFKIIESSFKHQAGTYQHKNMVQALKNIGQDLKTEMKLSELPKNFWKSNFIKKLSDELEIAEDILAGNIGEAYDEMWEDIQDEHK